MENTEQITEDQHYVPQFYLKQWVDEGGGFYPMKVEGRTPPKVSIFTQKSNPSRFCYENFFYAQHTGKGDEVSQMVEKTFAEIEAIFSKELPLIEKKILNNEQITDEEKYYLAQCMTFLHFRGKKYLDDSKRMTDEMMKQVLQRSVHFFDKDPKAKAKMEELGVTKEEMIKFAYEGKYTVDFGNIHHLRIMEDMQGFSNLLFAKYWRVYLSREGNFITTDAPYLDLPLSKEFWGNDFLSREQSFVMSPRVVIVATYPKNESGKKFVRKDITGKQALIQQLNVHSLMHCIRFGFHKDKDLLLQLEKVAGVVYDIKYAEKGSGN